MANSSLAAIMTAVNSGALKAAAMTSDKLAVAMGLPVKKNNNSASSAVVDTTMYGGKPAPVWGGEDFRLPGYQNCRIVYQNIRNTTTMYTWGFFISPNSLSITEGQELQTQKTSAGWFIERHGPAIGQLSFTGYFLDTFRCPERLRFFDVYKRHTENQNNFNEYDCDFSQQIIIEGVKYYGLIQSINQSKSGERPYIYQYTINFMFYKSKRVYSYASSAMTEDEMRKQTGIFTKRDYISQSTGVLSTEKVTTTVSSKMARALDNQGLLDTK